MNSEFLKYTKIVLISVSIVCVFLLFGELFGSYKAPQSYVKNETREGVNSYPFGQNIFFDEYMIRYPVNVTVIKPNTTNFKVGIVGDTDKLNFGKLPIYFSERKNIEIRNPMSNPIEIKIKAYGNVTKFLQYPNRIIINSGESKYATIRFNATSYGYYEGELDVIVRNPKYKILGGLIKWL